MSDIIEFTVSCSHVSPKWQLQNETVTVKSNDKGATWYCYIPNFGCSKSYAKPERAITGLLHDNGATRILYERKDGAWDDDAPRPPLTVRDE
jgi:hypothetical protein